MPFFVFAPGNVFSRMRLPDGVAFQVNGLSVYWYGILLAVALLSSLLLMHLESKRKDLGGDLAVDLCLVTIPAGLIGARLWHVISLWASFRQNPVRILYVWDGGLSIYGALVFAALGILIYVLCKKVPLLRLLDTMAPSLALAPAIAVWGDFFNQQGYGPEVSAKALQWFPFAVLIERTDTIHYAVFFYEFLWCGLLFLFLWLYLRKKARRDGVVFFTYLLLFSLGHGLTRLLISDTAYLYGSPKTAAILCAALFVLAAAALILLKKRPLPEKKPEPFSQQAASDGIPDAGATKEPDNARREEAPGNPLPPAESAAPSDTQQKHTEENSHA